MPVALRPVEDADLDALFDQMRDPEAVRMAAFTAEDPDDRAAFDAHLAWRREEQPGAPAKRPLIHNGRSGLMTTPRNGSLRGSRKIPDGPAYPD